MIPLYEKQKISKAITFAVLTLVLPCFAEAQGSGSGGRGGGTITETQLSAIQLFLAPGTDYLKKSLINYLDTLQADQIVEDTVKRILGDREHVAALRRDIEESRYRLAAPGECRNHENKVKAASAVFGQHGGEICFDPQKILAEVQSANEENILTHLACGPSRA